MSKCYGSAVLVYVICLFIAKCIDHYTKLCVENAECGEDDRKPIDDRLEAVVNRMFKRCFDDHQYKQVMYAVPQL